MGLSDVVAASLDEAVAVVVQVARERALQIEQRTEQRIEPDADGVVVVDA